MALVNKAIDGPHPLDASILFNYEVPTVGVAAWGLDSFWSPQYLIVDLMGTCAKTGPALRQQMFQQLPVWAKQKQTEHWSSVDFIKRSRLQWACLDCPPESCHLDQDLANYVKRIKEAERDAIVSNDF